MGEADRGPPHPLVGRDRERGLIATFLDVVRQGPAVFVLAGEAGIGKTTLWREGIRQAIDGGLLVLFHRADQAEAGLAFLGLADLLGGHLGEASPRLPPPQQDAITVALVQADAGGRAPDRMAVSMATLGLLRNLAERAPVLVAIDDAQWLDAPSAAALRFALRRLQGEPVGLLASVRVEEGAPNPAARLLDHRDGRAQEVPVEPLDVASVDRMLAERLGLELSPATLREVQRVSGGNPLYAMELGRAMAERGPREPGRPLPLSTTIRELLRGRLSDLPRATRDALELVSALARPTVPILRDALEQEPPLDPALDAGILEPDLRVLRFSHPLLGAVVYEEAPPGRKRRIHSLLAVAVEDAEERARHLALAATGPDRSVAEALEEAGDSVLARGAPEAAADLFEMARSMTPERDAHLRRRRTLQAVDAHLVAQDFRRARTLLEEELGTSPEGSEHAQFLMRLAYLTSDMASAERILDEATKQAADDTELLLRCAYHRSKLGFGRLHGAIDAARDAVRFAELLGDDAWLALSLTNLQINEFLLGRDLDMERMSRALRHDARAKRRPVADEGYFYEGPRTWLACMLMWKGELDEARRRLEEVRSRALEHGDELSASAILLHLTELECLAGKLERAREHADSGFRSHAREGVQVQASVYALALAHGWLGNLDDARRWVNEGIQLSVEEGDLVFEAQLARTGGFVELSAGDLPAARTWLERAAVCTERMGTGDPCIFPHLPDFIEVLILDGEVERAEGLIAGLEEQGERLDRPWAQAAAARSRALLLAATGRVTEAIEAGGRALKHLSRLPSPHPIESGRALLVLGGVRRRARQKKGAREALEEARRTFDEIGARRWAEKASAELTRIGGRAPAPLELTPTERRVAEMAVAGRTNREIAEALFVSVRTVESTLTKVFRKTGATSRRDLRRLIP